MTKTAGIKSLSDAAATCEAAQKDAYYAWKSYLESEKDDNSYDLWLVAIARLDEAQAALEEAERREKR